MKMLYYLLQIVSSHCTSAKSAIFAVAFEVHISIRKNLLSRTFYFITDKYQMNDTLIIQQHLVTILVSSFQFHHATYTEVAVYNDRLMGWGGHVTGVGKIINAYNILVGKYEGKIPVRHMP